MVKIRVEILFQEGGGLGQAKPRLSLEKGDV